MKGAGKAFEWNKRNREDILVSSDGRRGGVLSSLFAESGEQQPIFMAQLMD